MIYVAVAVGIILVAVLLGPFFAGKGGLLAAGSSVNSVPELDALKDAIAKRFLEDETAFQEGTLGALAWQKRKQFLINRYIDAARRRDFLEHLEQEVAS